MRGRPARAEELGFSWWWVLVLESDSEQAAARAQGESEGGGNRDGQGTCNHLPHARNTESHCNEKDVQVPMGREAIVDLRVQLVPLHGLPADRNPVVYGRQDSQRIGVV